MKLTDLPTRFNIPFASSAGGGYVRTIPEASQIGIQDGAASLTDGFPPLNFLPVGAGGVPPFGQDMNGALKQITQWSRWQGAGGMVPFNTAFSTAIGGYPKYAIVPSVSTAGQFYMSSADDNTTDPDGGGASNWIAFNPVDTTTVINAYIAAGRPPQTAPYFTAAGSASASYANNVASVSTDFTLSSSHFVDPGTTFVAGVLTIGPLDAGIWNFNANLGINVAFNGWTSKVYISKNSAAQSNSFTYGEIANYGAAVTGNIAVGGSINLASGDTVRAVMTQNTGSTQNSSTLGRFSGSRVGV